MKALGMVEFNSIATGVLAGDRMLKCANVKLMSAQPVCPGKYIVMVEGQVQAVKSAVEAGEMGAKEELVDSLVIASLHDQVFEAIACTTQITGESAIGIIECFSLVTSIYCADAAVKSANIDLIEIRLGRGLGGKSYVVLAGDVSSVKHAVDVANEKFGQEGMLVRTVVIPSPHKDILESLM